jgi:hypothetical protein
MERKERNAEGKTSACQITIIQMVVVPFLRNNPSAVVFSAIYIFRQKIPGKIFGAHLGFSLQVFHS